MRILKRLKYNFNKLLLKAASLVAIGAFLFNTSLAWARPQLRLGQTKEVAIPTAVGVDRLLSPSQNLRAKAFKEAHRGIIGKFDARPVIAGLLHEAYVEHDMAVKRIVNPENKPLIGVYGGAGADVSNFLLSTNATEAYFISQYSGRFKGLTVKDLKECFESEDPEVYIRGHIADDYRSHKFQRGFTRGDMLQKRSQIVAAIAFELKAMGVDLHAVRVDSYRGRPRIKFRWNYKGAREQEYSITLVNADVTKPKQYADVLRGKRIDVYYQRAGNEIAADYEKGDESFLHFINNHMRPGGYFVTDDYIYHFMEERYYSKSFAFPLPLAQVKILRSKELEHEIVKLKSPRRKNKEGNYYGWHVRVRRKAAEGSKTILIISKDDLFGKVLGGRGYNVITARDTKEALEVLEAHRFEIDLVICDVDIDKSNGGKKEGLVLAHSLSEGSPEIPVILRGDTEGKEKSLSNVFCVFPERIDSNDLPVIHQQAREAIKEHRLQKPGPKTGIQTGLSPLTAAAIDIICARLPEIRREDIERGRITFCMFKPDGVPMMDKILKKMQKICRKIGCDPFEILYQAGPMRLDKKTAEALYTAHKDKPFYEALINYVTANADGLPSDKIILLVLKGEDGFWQRFNDEVVGVHDGSTKGSIRKIFGVSTIAGAEGNKVHCSGKFEDIPREILIMSDYFDADISGESSILTSEPALAEVISLLGSPRLPLVVAGNHPDDIEYATGGFQRKMVRDGRNNIYWVVFTGGADKSGVLDEQIEGFRSMSDEKLKDKKVGLREEETRGSATVIGQQASDIRFFRWGNGPKDMEANVKAMGPAQQTELITHLKEIARDLPPGDPIAVAWNIAEDQHPAHIHGAGFVDSAVRAFVRETKRPVVAIRFKLWMGSREAERPNVHFMMDGDEYLAKLRTLSFHSSQITRRHIQGRDETILDEAIRIDRQNLKDAQREFPWEDLSDFKGAERFRVEMIRIRDDSEIESGPLPEPKPDMSLSQI